MNGILHKLSCNIKFYENSPGSSIRRVSGKLYSVVWNEFDNIASYQDDKERNEQRFILSRDVLLSMVPQ